MLGSHVLLVFVSAVADKVAEGAGEDARSFTLPAMALKAVAECEVFLALGALEVATPISLIRTHHPP